MAKNRGNWWALMTIKEVTMSEQTKKAEVRPVKMIRQGAVAASIWKRQSPSGFEYFDFSLSRSWKSKGTDREGYSPNFFARSEEDLISVVKGATSWIADQQTCLPSETTELDL